VQAPALYWYQEPGNVDHWFHGVFEGGGAKGLAYAGALRALKERKCWFRAVAGSSAGAITAALIAAGLDPNEMARETETALKCFQFGFLEGLKRFTDTGGFFPPEPFRGWLNGVLVNQLKKTGHEHKENVTFEDLFTATKIELNVVAADLSLHQHVIFSYLETPNCAVADAVVASSSIPFAFPSMLLRVPEPINEKEKKSFHHTIVDGGVWSNFPLFVFEDRNFRRFYDRKPEEIDQARVLGFLLDRGGQEEIPRGEEIKFEWEVSDQNVSAREWRNDDKDKFIEKPTERSFSWLTWLLWPFAMLGRFIARLEGGKVRGRWPRPHRRLSRYLVDIVTGFQGGINGNVLFWLVCVVAILGPSLGIWFIVTSEWGKSKFPNPAEILLRLVSYLNGTGHFDWSIGGLPLEIVMTIFYSVLIALVILAIFISCLSMFVIHSSFRATRAILYGLVTTYVNGPGAPVWVSKRENIVALPILPNVTTLSFQIDPSTRERLAEAAYQATIQRLDLILLLAKTERGRGREMV
jgi:predicted acylesterase/phospholipase RssA